MKVYFQSIPRMSSESKFSSACLGFFLLLLCSGALNAQNLKYKRENVAASLGSSENEAIIKVESSVQDLSLRTTTGDPVNVTSTKNGYIFTIEVDLQRERELGDDGYLRRTLILESPNSNRLEIDIPEEGGTLNHETYYYTVTLPDKFPVKLSAEYVFTGSSVGAVRVSFGGRYGGYLGYKWGKYAKNGINIDNVNTDCDVLHAKELGYIRQSITGGVRIGLTPKPFPIYMFVGGGYGTYGRQWENNIEIFNTIYFYSDYFSGVDLEIGGALYFHHFYLSAGVNALIGNSRISVDYMIGLGLSF